MCDKECLVDISKDDAPILATEKSEKRKVVSLKEELMDAEESSKGPCTEDTDVSEDEEEELGVPELLEELYDTIDHSKVLIQEIERSQGYLSASAKTQLSRKKAPLLHLMSLTSQLMISSRQTANLQTALPTSDKQDLIKLPSSGSTVTANRQDPFERGRKALATKVLHKV